MRGLGQFLCPADYDDAMKLIFCTPIGQIEILSSSASLMWAHLGPTSEFANDSHQNKILYNYIATCVHMHERYLLKKKKKRVII